MIRVVILEVTNRPTYELVTRAGGDRPVYVGSAEWQERNRDNINIQTGPIPGMYNRHSPR